MKIYKIDVTKKQDDFNNIYSILDEHAKYALYPNTFFAISNEDLGELLKEEDNCLVSEIQDVENEVPETYLKNWIGREYIKMLHEEAEKEVQERTVAMYEILQEAEKQLKIKEGVSNGQKTKHKQKTDEDGSSSK